MNRFLGKMKLDDSTAVNNNNNNNNKDSKRWKKGKKVQDDEKPQLDFKVALPSNEDFRTSLIMPNLSMRFSMLREQDDPLSKIGKASDDSVLQPKRQSRLPDFGFAPSRNLNDIAEVSSISSSARPPWLTAMHDSFVSDDSADQESRNGSVISRPRPGEGNNLFGGRQKAYKIPTSASKQSLPPREGSMGKLVYEDDVTQSAFQKTRQAEKEAAAQEAAARHASEEAAERSDSTSMPFGRTSSTSADPSTSRAQQNMPQGISNSPILSIEQRGASIDSSVNSDHNYDCNSTPATSIASQPFTSPPPSSFISMSKTPNAGPLERSLTKRRLYEQSLDQNRQEQQVSALTRLNSIQKQRNFSATKAPPMLLSQPKSIGNLRQQEPSFQPYSLRPQSPTEMLTTFDSLSTGPLSPADPSSHPQSPTYIPLNEYDEINPLSSTIQPGDRGKATAMNAFQMPRQPFDEDQYLQRLQRLQQPSPSPEPETPTEKEPPRHSPDLTRFDSARQPSHDQITPPVARFRSVSQPNQPDAQNAFSVFQRAAAQMRGDREIVLAEEEEPIPDTHRTFFGDISASDDDDEDILADYGARNHYGPSVGRFRPGELENIQEHPNRRTPTPLFPEITEEEETEETHTMSTPSVTDKSSTVAGSDSSILKPETAEIDEQQLLPAETYRPQDPSKALGGLVHQHLRNTSNVSSAPSATIPHFGSSHLRNPSEQSSIYNTTMGMDSSPGAPSDMASRFGSRNYTSDNRQDSTYTHSNPWDLDDLDNGYYQTTSADNKLSAPTSVPQDTRNLVPAALKQQEPIKQNSSESQRSSETSTWQPEHKRELSAGTLLEREAFDKDIAARQKAIQENLKGIIEVESRGNSPQPPQGSFKAFNSMMKNKTSRDSMVKQEQPSKAMKMLGIGASGSQTSLPLSRKGSAINEEIRSPSDKFPSYNNSPRPSFTQRTPPMADQKTRGMFDMQRPRGESDASMSKLPSRPSPPSTSSGPSSRMRSNSQASSLRNQMHGDRMMSEASQASEGARQASPLVSSHAFTPGLHFSPNFSNGFSPQFTAQFSPQQSPNLSRQVTNISDSDRTMSATRSAMDSPIEPPMPMSAASMSQLSMSQASATMSNASLSQPQSAPLVSIPPQATYRTMPTTSVSAPSSATSATFKHGHGPSPFPRIPLATSPYHADPTPPASGSSTPVAYGPASPAMNPPNIKQGPLLRKRTVSKSDISEPILISSTSNVDTVDLPPGASLKNGMEPPPIPPVNRRRLVTAKKLFGLGSKQELEQASRYPNPGSPPPIPTSAPRSKMSPEPHANSGAAQTRRPGPRTVRSDEGFDRAPLPTQAASQRPAMTEGGMF